LIDIDEQGQSPFACKYHGWSYGFDGALLKTPLDESLKFCNKKLKTIPSSVQSEMIFINPTKGFLEDFKKSFDEDLISMECFFYRSSILHNCNWKLLVENVLEPYHISFVHQDSFVSLGLTSTSPYEWGENKLGSFNRVKAKNNSNKFYYHQSIGHNLFVSDTDGLITFISFFFPISPNQTLLIFELWESASLSNRPMYVREKLRQEAIHFSNKVLLEDKKIVEASQIGIQHSQKTHTLSPLAEPRIIHFHETYQTAMRDS
jgi:phenylpropionate dioxygenase-like ring-hydroxylating dioxygenase large terminal subunit